MHFKPHSQKQNTVVFSEKRIVIAGTGIQWGKACDIIEEILTIDGYVKAKDIKLGDTLFDRNGDKTTVIGVFPQGLRQSYEIITTDNKTFVVDENHNNVVIPKPGSAEKIYTTKELFEKNHLWGKAQIPSCKPIKFDHKKLLIPPYTLGVLLGDGYLKGSKFTKEDNKIVERIRKELPDHDVHTYCSGEHHISDITTILANLGLRNCLSDTKFIPEKYKYSSIEQRLELLRGLMDTDGTITNHGIHNKSSRKIEYDTCSKRLADDVVWLVESLGGKAWYRVKINNGYKKDGIFHKCKDSYRINVMLKTANPFWLQRKSIKYFEHERTTNKIIKEIRPVGLRETVCFSVDSPTKTFIAKNQIVTHNTESGVVWLRMMVAKFTDPRDNFLVTSPTYPIMAQSTMPAFNHWFSELGKYDKKENVFRIKGGGNIWFRTGQNPDSVVGITRVRAILCDEGGLYSLYFWENILGRSSFSTCPIRIVTSPYSLGWLYKDYIRPFQKQDPEILKICDVVQATSQENPYFPFEEYELKKKTMDSRRFNMMYGGRFDRMDGLVYDCADEDALVIEPFELPIGTIYEAGVDWGYIHPFAMVVRAVTPEKKHYQVYELKKAGMTINQMIEAAKQLLTIYPVRLFNADPARPEYIDMFNFEGIPTVKANNDIAIGIDRHYELIKTGRLKIFKGHHKHTIDELEKYHYPETKLDIKADQDIKDPNPVKQDDDVLDANRYVTMSLYGDSLPHKKFIRSEDEQDILNKLMKRPKRINAL